MGVNIPDLSIIVSLILTRRQQQQQQAALVAAAAGGAQRQQRQQRAAAAAAAGSDKARYLAVSTFIYASAHYHAFLHMKHSPLLIFHCLVTRSAVMTFEPLPSWSTTHHTAHRKSRAIASFLHSESEPLHADEETKDKLQIQIEYCGG